MSCGFSQASNVRPAPRPTSRFGLAGTLTPAIGVLNRNACPTSPAVNVAPSSNMPELESAASATLPSARHQLTSPGTGAAQTTGFTVSVALALLVDPKPLVTRTE